VAVLPSFLPARLLLGSALFAFSLALPCAARGDDTVGAVAGAVQSVNGHPIPGAIVILDGPLFAEWKGAEAKIVSEPEDKPWHLREFVAADLDGNLIRVFYDFRSDL